MFEVLLLCTAVCLDSFAVSVSYGLNKIKIPVLSQIVIAAVCTAVLAVSLALAEAAVRVVPVGSCEHLSGVLLITIGFFSFAQKMLPALAASLVKYFSKQGAASSVISILIDETKADEDSSHSLSVKEAAILAVTLSVDSLAAGFSAGVAMTFSCKLMATAVCAVLGYAVIAFGSNLGKILSVRIRNRLDVSVLTGIILIALGIMNLL